MKKNLLLYFALTSLSASVYADGLTATLQQGDVMTPFYGVNAFRQAYEAADSGAVITLSSGRFNTVTAIDKPMTIVGAYAFDPSDPRTTILTELTINANNVKVEGIYFSGVVTLGGIKNCHIKRCYIDVSLKSSSDHTNTLIDQSCVKADYAVKNGYNYCIKNSTIGGFKESNSINNIAFITNCVVWNWCDYYVSISSNTSSNYHEKPIAIYKNNMIGFNNHSSSSNAGASLPSGSEFYNNIFFYSYSNVTDRIANVTFLQGFINEGNISGKNWSAYWATSNDKGTYPASHMKNGVNPVGQDGTPIGIYGGSGFSEYPSIPRITSKSIDSNTDAEGKIKVKITVKAEE